MAHREWVNRDRAEIDGVLSHTIRNLSTEINHCKISSKIIRDGKKTVPWRASGSLLRAWHGTLAVVPNWRGRYMDISIFAANFC